MVGALNVICKYAHAYKICARARVEGITGYIRIRVTRGLTVHTYTSMYIFWFPRIYRASLEIPQSTQYKSLERVVLIDLLSSAGIIAINESLCRNLQDRALRLRKSTNKRTCGINKPFSPLLFITCVSSRQCSCGYVICVNVPTSNIDTKHRTIWRNR